MAWRYRQRYFEDGDFLDPDDWNQNAAEFVNEFNGGLDRDNFPEGAVVETRLEDASFNIMESDTYTSATTCDIGTDRMDWMAGDGTSILGELEIDVPTDGALVAEWSATWAWRFVFGYEPVLGDDSSCKFRITVNGLTIAETGPATAARHTDATYLVGAIPVQAGIIAVKVWGQVFTNSLTNRDTKYAQPEPVRVFERELCVTVRLR